MANSGTIQVGSYTFAITPKFETNYEFVRHDNEVTYGIIHNWHVEGWLVSGSVAGIAGDIDELLEQFRSGGSQDVLFQVDGVTRASLTQALLSVGPIIRNFEQIPSDGARANHYKFSFDVFGKQSFAIANVNDFGRIETEEIGPDGLSKTITVRAEGPGAKAHVRTLVPSTANIVRFEDDLVNLISIGTFVERNTDITIGDVGGTEGKDGLISLNETIEISGGRHSVNFVPVMGGFPFKIVGSIRPGRVTISGRVEISFKEIAKIERSITVPAGLSPEDIVDFSETEVEPAQHSSSGKILTVQKSWNIVAVTGSRRGRGTVPARFTVSELFIGTPIQNG